MFFDIMSPRRRKSVWCRHTNNTHSGGHTYKQNKRCRMKCTGIRWQPMGSSSSKWRIPLLTGDAAAIVQIYRPTTARDCVCFTRLIERRTHRNQGCLNIAYRFLSLKATISVMPLISPGFLCRENCNILVCILDNKLFRNCIWHFLKFMLWCWHCGSEEHHCGLVESGSKNTKKKKNAAACLQGLHLISCFGGEMHN